MRFFLLFLLFSFSCQSQSLLLKPVRINLTAGSVNSLLQDLNSQPGVTLSYSSEFIDLSKNVKLTGKEKTVEDYLTSILRDQQIVFIEEDGKIFLIPQPSQKKFTLNGYIRDKSTGERLIGASVYLPDKHSGTTSNTYGFFSITLEGDTINLQISYAGYITENRRLPLEQDLSVTIDMEPFIALSEMVIVNAEGRKNTQHRTIVGRIDLPVSLIKSVPALLGEPDVLKTFQLLPGVQSGSGGTSGLYVRGGSPDQNLILLDGVPVYNASHAFGLFSIFNADAVHHAEILKGGFPASHGGRVSSIIDVHMKEGDLHNLHGEGGIGLVFSKLTLEGPIKKDKSSFLISARRTFLDLIMRPLVKAADENVDPVIYFGDVNAKLNFPLGKKDRIYFSMYVGKDELRVKEKYNVLLSDSNNYQSLYHYGFSWGNITALARWNHIFNKKTFGNFSFTFTRYRFSTFEKENKTFYTGTYSYQQSREYFSGIQDWSFKADLDYLPFPGHFIKAGFAATVHRYRPGVNYFFQKDSTVHLNEIIDHHSLYAGEYDAYIEDDIRLSPRMKMNAGLRFSAFSVQKKNFFSLQPRFNWMYQLKDRWHLKASAGVMSQFIHLLTNSNLGLPTDLWLPATPRVPPQSSVLISTGLSYSSDPSIDISMELYYKSMQNVIEYAEGSGFGNVYTGWEEIVTSGKGKTYGIEWLLQKKKGSVTGMASYTLSRSQRQFQSINDGNSFPYKYDRRHEVKLAAIWQPSSKMEYSANWVFSSGLAVSMPSGYYFDPITRRYTDIYESRNGFRMPDHHRLDVAVKFIKQKKKWIRTWTISIYNAYARFNPFFRYKDFEYPDNKIVFKEVMLFPFLPSVSYQFKF